jgi:hypothetical protein
MWNLGCACAASTCEQRPDAGLNPEGAACHHMRLHNCCECDGDHSAWECPVAAFPSVPLTYAWPPTPPSGWADTRDQKLSYWRSHIYENAVWRPLNPGELPRPTPGTLLIAPDQHLSDAEPTDDPATAVTAGASIP